MTLKEIARLTGTSASAVSRVINDSGYVSEEKRRAIQKVLADFDYHKKEKAAANPLTAATVLIIADSLDVSDAYADYIGGINEELEAHGFCSYIYLSGFDHENEAEQLKHAYGLGFAGVIMISAIESPRLKELLKKTKCPVIALNRYLRGVDIDTVVLDNYKVGYLATQRLIESGHKRVAHLAGLKDSTASQDRVRGYIDAMRDAGLPIEEGFIAYGNHSYEKGGEYAERFRENGCTALFAASDRMALGFMDALYRRGLECPGDVSVICTEDTKNLMSGKVRLTTIGYHNRTLGKTAAQLLLERRADPKGEKKTISYAPQIIERDSISCLISDN